MIRLSAVLALVFVLAACGTTAQVEPQQAEGITVSMVEPVSACHVQAEAVEDTVVFTASEACADNRILPFRIVERDGPEIAHDGGVYAHNTTTWPASPGVWEVRHRQTDHLIGAITVP